MILQAQYELKTNIQLIFFRINKLFYKLFKGNRTTAKTTDIKDTLNSA